MFWIDCFLMNFLWIFSTPTARVLPISEVIEVKMVLIAENDFVRKSALTSVCARIQLVNSRCCALSVLQSC